MADLNNISAKLPNVSSSPHFRSQHTTRREMLDVCIALIPALIWGTIHFGLYALFVVLLTIATAVVAEYIYERLMHKPITIGDFSAAVTGFILGLNMPPSIPVWVPMIGSVFAIVLVKQLYGGLGQNFMNPAIAARCFLHIAYASLMNDFSYGSFDAMTSATPLALINSHDTSTSLADLFLGNIPGCIGEVSVLCLAIGVAYLMYRGVVTWRIPGVYLLTVFVLSFFAGGFSIYYAVAQIMAGGLFFGACIMANDYVTSPVTPNGQIIYAIFIGLMTFIIRTFAPSAEGVSYSILLGNLLVPFIESATIPLAFGKKKGAKGGAK